MTTNKAGTATITVETEDGKKTATCDVTVNAVSGAVDVTGVSLNKDSLTLNVGGSEQLTATVTPDNATNKNVTWTSNKPTVAEVRDDGTVTAKADGNATITVTTVDGGKTETCNVTVNPVNVPVTGVSLDKTSLMLILGKSKQLTATVTPSSGTNNVTWSSDDETVAKVSNDGNVTANKAGTATITAIATLADGTSVQAVCTVKVAAGQQITPSNISSLDLSRISGEYLLQLTGTWGSTDFSSLKNRINQANAKIILDMSEIADLTDIGDREFEGCTKLTSVTIPDSVTEIGEYAFNRCTGLTSVNIPSSVTSIGDSAFYGCTGLTSITIPDSVTSIGRYAFSGCTSLTSVTIGSGVTSIGEYAFNDCTNLARVDYTGTIAQWCIITFKGGSSNPLYYSHNLYINNSLVTDLVIPDSVTSISNFAFSGCTSLTSVTIPDSVTSIGRYAFSGCTSLTSVTIGSGVTSIGEYAFNDCERLTSVTIPDSVTSISSRAFAGCTGLTSITIGSGVTSIGEYAFYGCTSLTSVTIGSGVTSIGEYAFSGCTGLTSITIPSSVTKIGRYAFSGCSNLTSITFDSPAKWGYLVVDYFFECDLSNPATNADYFTRSSGSPNDSLSWSTK